MASIALESGVTGSPKDFCGTVKATGKGPRHILHQLGHVSYPMILKAYAIYSTKIGKLPPSCEVYRKMLFRLSQFIIQQ
jgi:hypothetical protein